MSTILKVKEARFAKLSNDEYTQFIRSIEKLIPTNSLDNLGINENHITLLKDYIEKLTDVIRHSRTSSETEELIKLDKQRGNIVVYILAAIRNDRKSPIEARQKSALFIYNFAKNYQGIQSLPNRSKTQAIESLLLDFAKPENTMHINTLALTETIQQLSELNKKYDELIAKRADSQVINRVDSAKKIRLQVDKLYEEISLRAFAYNIYQPSEIAKNFIISLNKLINDTNNAYKQRTGRLKNK